MDAFQTEWRFLMNKKRLIYAFSMMFVLLVAVVFPLSRYVGAEGWEREGYEGREHGREMGEGREGREGRENERFNPVSKDSVYSQECGSCHFLYFPGLLPESSWVKLMSQTDHFGEELGLEPALQTEILDYLKANSADKNRSNEWSSKIVRSLGVLTPVRITEVPYITRKHGKIRRDIFERESVGTLSNCGACHKTGAQGDFEEDNVKIPR